MLHFVPSLDIYVTKIDDLRDKIDDDVFNAINELIEDENDDLLDDYDNLKDEFECYEAQLDEKRSAIIESCRILEDMNNKLDELYEYLMDAKRINREHIKDVIKDVDLSNIKKILENSL